MVSYLHLILFITYFYFLRSLRLTFLLSFSCPLSPPKNYSVVASIGLHLPAELLFSLYYWPCFQARIAKDNGRRYVRKLGNYKRKYTTSQIREHKFVFFLR